MRLRTLSPATLPISARTMTANPGITGTRVGASLGATTLNNGGTATVHVTVPAGAASGNQAGLIIISSHTPDDGTIWPIAIDVQ